MKLITIKGIPYYLKFRFPEYGYWGFMTIICMLSAIIVYLKCSGMSECVSLEYTATLIQIASTLYLVKGWFYITKWQE